MISFLCPSRSRPKELARFYKSLADNVRYPDGFELLVYVADNDPMSGDYWRLTETDNFPNMYVVRGPDQATSMSWNHLASMAKGDVMVLAADDMICETKHFDDALFLAGSKGDLVKDFPVVMSFDDARGPKGSSHPHPAINRVAYDRLGFIAHPAFMHWYVDTYLVAAAVGAGCFRYLPDVVFRHQKPSDAGPGDETHQRIRKGFWPAHDRATWAVMQRYISLDAERLKND